jgi:hypothetical protein
LLQFVQGTHDNLAGDPKGAREILLGHFDRGIAQMILGR